MKIASANNTHPLSGTQWQQRNPEKFANLRKTRSKNAHDRVANGTHAGTTVFSTIHTCPHCNTQGKGAIMYRFHYNNCKLNIAS